jgi:dihydroorotase
VDRITLTRPDDWHLHLRDGPGMASVLADTARCFARAIVMPNLKPPVTTTQQALHYRERILGALPDGAEFEPLMTLYLTDDTPPEEITRARLSGRVFGVKLYPAGATTHSDAGVTRISRCFHTLERMQDTGMPLLVHAESTDPEIDVFDRERVFLDDVLGPMVERFPSLKIVVEHATTRDAVQFVEVTGPNVAATITAHHLLLNRNSLFVGGIRPHHFCLPVLKREEHREALVEAATSGNPKFFLGTDSAPHPTRTRKRPAAAPASTPRMPRSSCTRRPSRRPARSTGSKASPPSSARASTACRRTRSASPSSGRIGARPSGCRSARRS